MSTTLSASVVINNFNYARFLGHAIRSALEQTFMNTEVVVVDDGSSDHSREVIGGYKGRIIPILKENGGQASAFNAGFEASRGDIVVFLDSDDALCPEAIASVVELFKEEELVTVRWPMWETDEEGNRTGRICPRFALAEGDLRNLVLEEGPVIVANTPTSGNAWSRHFLEKVLPVPEYGDKHGGDAYLCNLAPIFGFIKAVSQPLGFYRVHANSFSPRSTEALIRRDLQRFPHLTASLATYFEKQGVKVDTEKWMAPGTPYDWMKEMLQVPQELSAIIPAGQSFILVDEDLLGHEFVPGRRALSFIERDGEYWGLPLGDETAINELERLREGGAAFIAFVKSSFWWLDHYAGFHAHLESRFRRVLTNSRVVVFDLSVTQEAA